MNVQSPQYQKRALEATVGLKITSMGTLTKRMAWHLAVHALAELVD